MIHLKQVADEIQRNRALQCRCIVCYIVNSFRFLLLSQMCASKCSTMLKANLKSLKFFLNIVITKKERQLCMSFERRDLSPILPILNWQGE